MAGAALVGCGDDDDAPDAPTPPAPTETDDDDAAADPSGPGDWQGARRGGVVTSTLGDDPPSLDPFGHRSFLSQYIGAHAYGRLLKFSSGPGITPLAEMEPDLAESFEVADDGVQVTFNIRQGVQFHDKAPINGREMDAEDVVSSFERFVAESPEAGLFSNVEAVEAVDSHTVVFTLDAPSAGFIENVTAPTGMWIMSKEANHGDINPTQVDGVIGTGPWILTGHRSSVELSYDANPNYFVTAPGSDERLPLLDGLRYLIIGEYAQQMTQFLGQETHVFTPRNADIEQVRSQYRGEPGEMSIRPGWLKTVHWMNKETNNGLFNDERARRALSMALDRDGLIDAFGEVSTLAAQGIEIDSGWSTTVVPWGEGGMFWWLDPKSADFGDAAQWYQYDPAEAQRLLDAVGYDGSDITMNFVTGTYGSTYDTFTEAQIPMLRDAGFSIAPTPREYSAMIGSEQSQEFPGIFYNYNTPYTTIGEYMEARFGEPVLRFPEVRRYTTPELEDLHERQKVEFDREARRELVHEAQRLSTDYMVAVPSVMSRWGSITMHHPALRNREHFQSTGYGFAVEERLYWWMDE